MRWRSLILLLSLGCHSRSSSSSSSSDGPRALFMLDVGSKIRRAVLSTTGDIVVSTESELLGLRDGERAWAESLKLAPFLLAISDGAVVTRGADSRLVAFDARTGRVVFSVGSRVETELPLDKQDLETLGRFAWSPPQALARTSSAGKELLVAILEDGRILRISPERCRAKDARACSVVRGRAPFELPRAVELDVLPDGSLVVIDIDQIEVVSPTGLPRFEIRAERLLGGARVVGDRLIVAIDDRLLALDPKFCDSRELLRFSLPRSSNTTTTATGVPKGCVILSRDRSGLLNAPTLVGDTLVANASDATFFASERGDDKLDLDAIGPLIARGDRVITLASSTENRLRFLEIRPAERSVREVRLPIELPGLVVSSNDLLLDVSGPYALAGHGSKVALVSLGP
ncbi:MAG: hypothetical protein HY791_36070 [Deltaproteobacteria bacterium]|nr:hypothetical protein [Deltaproteobacteria bacterium]